MLPSPNFPPLPPSRPETLFSYTAYPISARESVHSSLRPKPSHPSTTSLGGGARLFPSASNARSIRGESWISTSHTAAAATASAESRAAHRALRSKYPAGRNLAAEADDLSDEEHGLNEEKTGVNSFGHRFLLPFGRRLTQMEMEAAPSPTPSDHDHRQEDRNGAASPALATPEPLEAGASPAEIDLDASLEDRDANIDDAEDSYALPRAEEDESADPDRSTEYDSDDLRLMRAMDRSVGSRTESEVDLDESVEDMDAD